MISRGGIVIIQMTSNSAFSSSFFNSVVWNVCIESYFERRRTLILLGEISIPIGASLMNCRSHFGERSGVRVRVCVCAGSGAERAGAISRAGLIPARRWVTTTASALPGHPRWVVALSLWPICLIDTHQSIDFQRTTASRCSADPWVIASISIAAHSACEHLGKQKQYCLR
jgi:hypothetical protein